MAAVSQKTLNWLWDVLRREYRDPQRAYSDVVQTLSTYPTFAPRTDVYTFENGTSALLLHLNGTVPVNFRGASYQFPVAVWIPQNYPAESPMLYVTPTEGMVIRPGQHVSGSDGRIYHPYLARWREAWERSTVVDFLKILTEIFAREPPVMSRQQMPPVQQQPQTQARPPPARPLPPIEQRPPSARPPSMVGSTAAPPPPPPKGNQDVDGSRSSLTGSPDLRQPGRYDAAPPLPGQASRPISTTQQARESYPPQFQNQRSNSTRQSYPPQLPPQPMPQQNQRFSIAGPPQQYSQQQSQQPHLLPQGPVQQNQYQQPPLQQQPQQQPSNVRPPQPVQHYTQQPAQPYPITRQPQPNFQQPVPMPPLQQQISQQKPKPREPNLMDESPFDISLNSRTANLPTPAIPPNPEKQHLLDTLSSSLLQNLHEQISQSTSALPLLASQQQALSNAQLTLQSELQQLQTLQSQLSSNISALNSTLSSADRVISNAKKAKDGKGVPSIDECVIPPTVVARQLYDAVAEQRGYEAAIYALTDGFVKGRMESKVWERKTRECAREEFKRKWLVKRRLAWGLGLDTSVLDH